MDMPRILVSFLALGGSYHLTPLYDVLTAEPSFHVKSDPTQADEAVNVGWQQQTLSYQ